MSPKKNVVTKGGEVKVYATNLSKANPDPEKKRGKREAMDKVTDINYDLSKNGKKTYRIKGLAKNKKKDGEHVGMSVQVSEENAKKVADALGMKITKSKPSGKPKRKGLTKTQKKAQCNKVGKEAKEKCLKDLKVKKKSPSMKNGSAKNGSSKRKPGRPKKSQS